jgi:hypothetical protein
MAESKPEPAPYDWHNAATYSPLIGEVVIVYQLWPGWARLERNGWVALGSFGNPAPLTWKPEFWRREYIPKLPKAPNA